MTAPNIPPDGGSAFPRPHSTGPNDHEWAQEGMSLRDYFAGKAMIGIISSEGISGSAGGYLSHAQSAYRYADAMIEARSAT